MKTKIFTIKVLDLVLSCIFLFMYRSHESVHKQQRPKAEKRKLIEVEAKRPSDIRKIKGATVSQHISIRIYPIQHHTGALSSKWLYFVCNTN
jgi:hypothetical protein